MESLALGTQLIGQVTSGVANYRAGTAAEKSGNVDAESERLAAEYNAQRSLARNRFAISKGRAIAGASGLDPGTGSPLEIALNSAMQAEMDANAIRYGGKIRGEEARQRGRIIGGSYKNRAAADFLGTGTVMTDWLNRYGGGFGGGSITSPSSMGSWADRVPRGRFTITG
jgi:hypothetical protein